MLFCPDCDEDKPFTMDWNCPDCGRDNSMQFEYKRCGPEDKALIDRVGNKFKHASTLEHLQYNFHIDGVSRALLQELARHRIASLSVKSTRYTLKELKDEKPFARTLEDPYGKEYMKRAENYLVFTGVTAVDDASVKALENLREVLSMGIPNDKAKFCLPESYKTSLAWSVNARSLQNFLRLRSSKAALWEIRELANALYEAIPTEHKFIFDECMYKEEKTDA